MRGISSEVRRGSELQDLVQFTCPNQSDPVNPAPAGPGEERATRLLADEGREGPAFLLESLEEVHRCCCPGAAAPRTDIAAGDVLSSRTGGARESTTTITQQTAINGGYLRKKMDRDPETPCVQ